MANFIWFYMIMFSGGVCCLSFTSIGSAYGDNILECNAHVTMVCKTEKGQDSIVFKINDIQAANCVHGCYVNTPILGNYTLSHDSDAGVIRLHIHKVSAADASNTFTCEGDLTTLSIKPVIKVFPEKSSTSLIINETNSTNVVEIKALTGCVLLQANLTFVWNKTRNSNGSDLESLPDEGFIIKNTDLAENSKCIPSDHCGGEASSSTLTFTEETNGGVDYYITCTIVINENVSENKQRNYTVITERTFAIKEPNVNVLNSDQTDYIYLALLCLIPIAALPILAIKHMRERDRQEAPTDLKLVSKTERSATFTWTPGRYFCGHEFRFCFISLHDEKASLREENVKKPIETILNLQPGCRYRCYVYGVTGKRKSNNSTSVDFTTLGLPDAPTDLQAVNDTVTETSVTLKWKPGKYRIYRQKFVLLYLRKDHGNLEWTNVFLEDDLKPTTFYKVENLKEATSYKFKVQAKNDIGESESSDILSIETKGKPESPSDLREVKSKRTSNSITVSWKPGTYRRDTQKFVIYYKYSRSKTWTHKK